MKTDDLIAALSVDLPATPRHQIERRLLLWAVPAMVAVLFGVAVWLGFRDDLASAMIGPVFWAKVAYTFSMAVGGFWLLNRLGRPGARFVAPLVLIGATLLAVILLGSMDWMGAPVGERMPNMMGGSARVCPTNILALSAVAAPFIFWAARRLAPLNATLAGAAAGLFASGLAATLYGLHCPEHTASFVAVWYTLGLAISTVFGAVLGRFVLRW